ncbi:MAG: hypothetical protein NVV73_13370 [Cellvibrionaceae bacterium]|nr:hypothetical protein [Cellvibrionaceae bacterium]
MPSQLNAAGSDPFASNDALRKLRAAPPDELLLEEELEEDELLLELDELDEELLDVSTLPPPQAARAAERAVMPHAIKILFMVVSYIKRMRNLLDINNNIPTKTLFDNGDHPDHLCPWMTNR